MNALPPSTSSPCPCGSGKSYAACCGPCHAGTQSATTAEALMRSRYSAFVLKDAAYLLRTWHPSTRPAGIGLDPDDVHWLALTIVRTEAGTDSDRNGMVEFIARYRTNGQTASLHEASRFTREEGAWYYLDGKFERSGTAQGGKPGRNAACPCGSGKKYKRCCGRQ